MQNSKQSAPKVVLKTMITIACTILFTLYLVNFQFWLVQQKVEEAIYGDPNKIIVKDCFDPVEWQKIPIAAKLKMQPSPKLPVQDLKIMEGLAPDPFMSAENIPKFDTQIQVRVAKKTVGQNSAFDVEALIRNTPAKLRHLDINATIRRKNVIFGGESLQEIFCDQLNTGNSDMGRFFRVSFTTDNPLIQKKSREFVLNLECIYELDQAIYGPQHIFREMLEIPMTPE